MIRQWNGLERYGVDLRWVGMQEPAMQCKERKFVYFNEKGKERDRVVRNKMQGDEGGEGRGITDINLLGTEINEC
jgi:hypothetical protein